MFLNFTQLMKKTTGSVGDPQTNVCSFSAPPLPQLPDVHLKVPGYKRRYSLGEKLIWRHLSYLGIASAIATESSDDMVSPARDMTIARSDHPKTTKLPMVLRSKICFFRDKAS